MKLFRTFLSFVLLTALILPFSGQTFAAKTMTATVEVDKLNIRAKTSISATKLGSLTKGTKVTVYKKTASGWSQIIYNKKTAYVSTQYLTFKSKKTSYLPNPEKVYTYDTTSGIKKHYSTGKTYNSEWVYWYTKDSYGNKTTFVMRETKYGLDLGWPESEYTTEIAYPIKNGKKFYGYLETRKIIAVNQTVKTKAGTFKKVVVVQSANGYKAYYAPNVGCIKTIKNSKTVFELIKIE
ncbi:SH3 domain-containing protein [Viridibacillus sp. YIM B01967]|uniref:SH3 domain-containing protein n=1 Tax=Viridibacillus soli TaxID=2798301 RepID=A0ABS1H6T3_9BACL|nr:SH3 domain-containing protein [Viridibacillus soli]MBK3495125.1 SH3 domain-containing protein [Viridibacillus soli]